MYQIPFTSKLSMIDYFKMATTHLRHLVISVIFEWLVSECRQIIERAFVVTEVSGIRVPCGGQCAAHVVRTVSIFKFTSSNGESGKFSSRTISCVVFFTISFVSVVFIFVLHKHLSSVKSHQWCVAVLL